VLKTLFIVGILMVNNSRRRVVISGLGTVSPLGNTVAETWAKAKAGTSGIARITRFDVSLFSAQIAGEVKNFDPASYLEAKEIKKHDIFSHYSIAAAQEAWDDANLQSANIVHAELAACWVLASAASLP
jgi:3-oxoacyl-[acyl-carrier-protein] synthase II